MGEIYQGHVPVPFLCQERDSLYTGTRDLVSTAVWAKDLPASSDSLYRLNYPDRQFEGIIY